MAYNINDERLLELMVLDPSYCLFYHRERVRQILPTLAKSHMLVEGIKKEISGSLMRAEGAPDGRSGEVRTEESGRAGN